MITFFYKFIQNILFEQLSRQSIMKWLFIFAFTISLSAALKHVASCRKTEYVNNQLVLTWPPQYCDENSCKNGWKNGWDGKSFTIHGFWPNSNSFWDQLECMKQQGYDPYCRIDYKYNKSDFPASLAAGLDKRWIEIGRINNFRGYEWDKHGTCYIYNMIKLKKQNISQRDAFIFYFQNTANLADKYANALTKGTYKNQDELGVDLDLWQDEFYAICGDDNELDEIRICYSIKQANESVEHVIPCPQSKDRNLCKYPIQIRGFV